MEKRTLTVTIKPDWRAALRTAARDAFAADAYQGETLNFETPAAFFSRLTEKRWAMLYALQGAGEVPVRELARRLERDVKRPSGCRGAGGTWATRTHRTRWAGVPL